MSKLRLDTSLEMMLERYSELAGQSVIATIVSTAGSTYRKAGARALIESDGRITGMLSGGCVEQDLCERAYQVLRNGRCQVVTYDTQGDDDLIFGSGAGCEGLMRILLEPGHPGSSAATAVAIAAEMSAAGRLAVLATVHIGPLPTLGTRVWPPAADQPLEQPLERACEIAVETGSSRMLHWVESKDIREAWIQLVTPLPRILICGAGADAQPLAAQFRNLRFPVTVYDHRSAYADMSRFPEARLLCGAADELAGHLDLREYFAAIVMSHHLATDAAYLRILGSSSIPYVGLLGPHSRRIKLLHAIGSVAHQLQGRFRAPAGLDIGAVTPEGIALAICAEVQAAAADHHGGPHSRDVALLRLRGNAHT
jgi:xanthine dehydrogenase accessory factor